MELPQSSVDKDFIITTEECEKIVPKPDQLVQKFDDDNVQIIMFIGGQVIVCVPGDKDVKSLITSSTSKSGVSREKLDHSDLIPGIYEGIHLKKK